MDNFRIILENLRNESDRAWIVEAVFSDQSNPSDDLYSTLTVCKTKDEADAKASELCSTYGHPFLTYRARPFGTFRPYVDFKPSSTVYKCDDEKLNSAYEARIKRNHEFKRQEEKRREAMELQDKDSMTAGTVQHFCRAIYTCFFSSMRIQSLSEDLKNSTDGYDKAFRALCTGYSLNNKLINEWEAYLEHQLELFGDTHTLPNLKTWFIANRKILEGSKITDCLAEMAPEQASLAIAELNNLVKPINPIAIPTTPLGTPREVQKEIVVDPLPVPSYHEDSHENNNYEEDHICMTTKFGLKECEIPISIILNDEDLKNSNDEKIFNSTK